MAWPTQGVTTPWGDALNTELEVRLTALTKTTGALASGDVTYGPSGIARATAAVSGGLPDALAPGASAVAGTLTNTAFAASVVDAGVAGGQQLLGVMFVPTTDEPLTAFSIRLGQAVASTGATFAYRIAPLFQLGASASSTGFNTDVGVYPAIEEPHGRATTSASASGSWIDVTLPVPMHVEVGVIYVIWLETRDAGTYTGGTSSTVASRAMGLYTTPGVPSAAFTIPTTSQLGSAPASNLVSFDAAAAARTFTVQSGAYADVRLWTAPADPRVTPLFRPRRDRLWPIGVLARWFRTVADDNLRRSVTDAAITAATPQREVRAVDWSGLSGTRSTTIGDFYQTRITINNSLNTLSLVAPYGGNVDVAQVGWNTVNKVERRTVVFINSTASAQTVAMAGTTNNTTLSLAANGKALLTYEWIGDATRGWVEVSRVNPF